MSLESSLLLKGEENSETNKVLSKIQEDLNVRNHKIVKMQSEV